MPDFSFKYKGTGSGSLWANFVKWSPSSASFIGALSDVDLQLPDLAPLRLKFIKGKVSGNMSDKAYGLSTENFSFELESGEKLPPLDMSLKLDRDGKEFTGGSFKANSLVFQGMTYCCRHCRFLSPLKISSPNANSRALSPMLIWIGRVCPTNPSTTTANSRFTTSAPSALPEKQHAMASRIHQPQR